MTRITKTLISVLATLAMTVGAGSSAMAADYSSANAALGDQQSAPAPQGDNSSVSAIVGDRDSTQSGSSSPTVSTSPSSPNSIIGSDGATNPTVIGSAPQSGSDGFDWSDALIGAGVAFGLALTAALMLRGARRSTRVEPSV
jgi:hypothetical protein